MSEEHDDRLLVEAAQRDPARFADLYEQNFYRVYAYIVRRVQSRPQAEDLTADVFREALAGIQSFEWRGVPFITGVATTIIQILAGVGGLFLDIFFQKSMLDRKTTNATKAVAQSFSHVVRALYFGSLSGVGDLPLWATGPAIVLAIAGTSLAPFVIERMTDHGLRKWTRAIIFAISALYLARAGWLFWNR